ncbi:MAG: hypothetical protein M1827_006193 [Pycnora praestabilis]|nr:MAG: hypothetical protein M1827_006193 [Pycnora praestabilis]
MARKCSFIDLPNDILLSIFPYLDAQDFLSLCSITPQAIGGSLRDRPFVSQISLYYKPMEHDGSGYINDFVPILGSIPGAITRMAVWARGSQHKNSKSGGLMLGFGMGAGSGLTQVGWSTTVLNSKGALFTSGLFDPHNPGGRRTPIETGPLNLLRLPPGYPQASDRYDPATAIAQFSSGRSHVLGVSDNGKIWMWRTFETPGFQIKFLHFDTMEDTRPAHGRVTKVIGGWSRCSAYILGTGIVVWDPTEMPRLNASEMTNTMIIDADMVPNSGYRRPRGIERELDDDSAKVGEMIGEVVNYISLEGYIVFVTDLGKVFASSTANSTQTRCGLVELPVFTEQASELGVGKITDIQGSFRTFAVFTTGGGVFKADRQYLDTFWKSQYEGLTVEELPKLLVHPALQQTGVISLAFGDYHFHALHSDGQISSYGTDSQMRGALGLGDYDLGGKLRGVEHGRWASNGVLIPRAYESPRHIWFEKEKQDWLEFMAKGGKDPEEARERMVMIDTNDGARECVSDWIEKEGSSWGKHTTEAVVDDDGFGAYFALSVSAGGWHSGALMLVNDELTEMVRQTYIKPKFETSGHQAGVWGILQHIGSTLYYIASWMTGYNALATAENEPNDAGEDASHSESEKQVEYIWSEQSFPRLRLPSGEEMPGDIPLTERVES